MIASNDVKCKLYKQDCTVITFVRNLFLSLNFHFQNQWCSFVAVRKTRLPDVIPSVEAVRVGDIEVVHPDYDLSVVGITDRFVVSRAVAIQ